MHELSICQSLLKQIGNIAAEHNATAVENVYLQVGPLSGIEPELLQSVFPFASANTIAEQAKLIISAMPIRVRCKTCFGESEASINRLVCGLCGDWQTELLAGDELLLERVEMRTDH
ncbi:MAG: hydrogenase maturation nickel metallochaperone HypA [Gammaproteobacteria bacterium]|nr:hydrogenase maturation nickel metallochaperone HypA [Gammaproteobacteria bacterium]